MDQALGFEGDTSITMTNKIEKVERRVGPRRPVPFSPMVDCWKVELVWTLGAMLAKSAELLADIGSGGLSAGSVLGGLVVLGAPPPPRSELRL